MPSKTKEDPPFVMRLTGPKVEMFRLIGPLMDLLADVSVRSTKTKAHIVAYVPQKNAKAAMDLAGLP